MFKSDKGLGRVGTNFTRPEDPALVGINSARIAKYRSLCNSVGAENCIEGYDATYERLYGPQKDWEEVKDPIWIHMSAMGLSVSGSGKGYVYSQHPSFPIVADLDSLAPAKSGTWFRHIEGHWYVYYDYED